LLIAGTLIVIEDFTQDLEVDVGTEKRNTFALLSLAHEIAVATAILNVENWETEEEELEVHKFVLGGSKPTAKAAKDDDSSSKPPAAGADDDDDDVVWVDDSTSAATKKRGRSDGTSSRSPKKSKPSTDDVIVVIDD
jgi:hypothetical protein